MMLIPAFLFYRMSHLSTLPPVDARLLAAFTGGYFVVYAIGRPMAAWVFRLDGVTQSVFALGVSVEWAGHGASSIAGLGKTAFKVLTNPIVAAILLGSACAGAADHGARARMGRPLTLDVHAPGRRSPLLR